MGRMQNILVDTRNWLEVIEHQTFIYQFDKPLDSPICTGCGNHVQKGERITLLLTSKNEKLYFHESREKQCLKGIQIHH